MPKPEPNALLAHAVEAFKKDVDTFVSRVQRAIDQAVNETRRRPINDTFTDGRGRRTQAALDEVMAEVYAYIQEHPHERVEQIARGLGHRTGELKAPIRRLLTEQRVCTRGKARGTSYAVAEPPAQPAKRTKRVALHRGYMLDDGKKVETWAWKAGAKKAKKAKKE
jgi:hypothetical protein